MLDKDMTEAILIKMLQDAAKAELELDKNFVANGKTYLVHCPKCGKENYAPSVASGICAWCGYNANKESE